MPDVQLICPACGRMYQPSAEYLAENAGLEMDCECGQTIAIPSAEPQSPVASPPMLSYAAPDFPPKPIRGVWRDDRFVVVARGSRLPNRCCICNEPVMGATPPRILSWTPKSGRKHLRMGGRINPVAGLLDAAIAESYSQSIVVHVGRCPKHRLEFKPVTVALTLLALAIASFTGCATFVEQDPAAMIGAATVLVLLIAAMIVWRIKPRVHVVDFQGNFAWLTGFSHTYLESLPPYAEMIESTRQNMALSLEQLQDAEPEMEHESEQTSAAISQSDEIDLTPAVQSQEEEGYWKSGKFVVLARGSRLPDRCCICNATITDEISPRTLTWTPSSEASIFKHRGLPGGKLISGAIADSYSESIVVHMGRCPEHEIRLRPTHGILMLLAVIIACTACIWAYLHGQTLTNIAGASVAVCLLTAALIRRFRPGVRVVRFEGNLAWLDGFAAPYVESLPPYRQMLRAKAKKTAQMFDQIQ